MLLHSGMHTQTRCNLIPHSLSASPQHSSRTSCDIQHVGIGEWIYPRAYHSPLSSDGRTSSENFHVTELSLTFDHPQLIFRDHCRRRQIYAAPLLTPALPELSQLRAAVELPNWMTDLSIFPRATTAICESGISFQSIFHPSVFRSSSRTLALFFRFPHLKRSLYAPLSLLLKQNYFEKLSVPCSATRSSLMGGSRQTATIRESNPLYQRNVLPVSPPLSVGWLEYLETGACSLLI